MKQAEKSKRKRYINLIVAKLLLVARILADLSQEALGNMLHLHFSTVSRMERVEVSVSEHMFREWIAVCKKAITDRLSKTLFETLLFEVNTVKFA